MFFDPLYFVILAPGMLLAMWAQYRVSSAYARGSQLPASSGLTGAQAAAEILRSEGIEDVAIEPVRGQMTDHYDPQSHVLRLSEGVYGGRTLAALGIAAHEAGHAVQDARGYAPLGIRNLLVPVAGLGSSAAWLVIFAGLILHMTGMVLIGLALFSGVVLFQVVNLPVEYDASRRAKLALASSGLISQQEAPEVSSVLSAAALTYVAATLTSVLMLLYYVLRSGIFGDRRDD